MADGTGSDKTPGGLAAALEQLAQSMSGLTADEIEEALQALLTSGTPLAGLSERPAPPSRRRPRRGEVVTYLVRIDLNGTRPPLWRRLELASDLFLDQVHQVIQVAFGWTDSHLHQFGSGPGRHGPEAEYYLCPFQAADGETGIPEEEVRLDEVLADPGDKLFYDYDFGDDWEHTVKLEAVLPRTDSGPRAVCVAGRRDGPAEDCGGVYAYELICAASDPHDPDHAGAAAEFSDVYGEFPDPEDMRVTPFDIGGINEALDGLAWQGQVEPDNSSAGEQRNYPAPLGELVRAARTTAGKRELRQLIGSARLDQPVLVDAATASRMVRPYAWLLDRVGDDGIKLTSAGYLPPAHVEAAMTELGLGEERIGKANRESQTLPVLHLRESAANMGLLRKRHGTLLLTSQARKLRGDPVALWWYLAKRMPPRSPDACETHAGVILLLALAAEAAENPDEITARLLDAIGWVSGDGTELTELAAGQAAWDTKTVLGRLGALTNDDPWGSTVTPAADGVAFARAAVRSWP